MTTNFEPNECVIFVHSMKIGTQENKVIHSNQYLNPGHNSLRQCWIWMIFHTIIIRDARVCHDIGPRLYIKGQGHNVHVAQIFFRIIFPSFHVGSG